MLQLGFAYDTSPVTEANRSPALPVDRQVRLAVGVHDAAILPNLRRSRRFVAKGVSSHWAAGWRPHWDINPGYTVGLDYEYASLGSAHIDLSRASGVVQGDYQTNSLNVFNLTVVHRF